jgi:hypothetical protein
MKSRIAPAARTSKPPVLPLVLLGTMVMAAPLLSLASDSGHDHAHGAPAPAQLVQLVRLATLQFMDVNKALAAGYGPFLGCVSGPDHGAMGTHYVNLNFYADGEIDVWHPEALMYEGPADNLHLVGAEFIVDAQTWLANHNNTPPVLEGQSFQLVNSPNRYNLPAFFELHVWAWRENPDGAFVDWNNHVTCGGQ